MVLAATLGVVLCLLAAYLLGPALVGLALERYEERHPQRSIAVEGIAVNPLTLAIELHGIDIIDADTARITVERAVVNFGVSGLFRDGYTVDSLTINQAGIMAPSAPGLGPELLSAFADRLGVEASDRPPFRIGSLSVVDSALHGAAGDIVLEHVDLTAAGLRRTADGLQAERFELGWIDAGGAAFAANGTLRDAPFTLAGHFALERFDLGRIDSRPPLMAASGEARLGGEFVLTGARGERAVTIDGGRAEISALAARYGASVDVSAQHAAAAFSADIDYAGGLTRLTGTTEVSAEAVVVDDHAAAGGSTLAIGRLGSEAEFAYANAEPRLAGSLELTDVRLTHPGTNAPALLASLIGASGVTIDGSAGVVRVDAARAEAPAADIDLRRPGVALPEWLVHRRIALRHLEITGGRIGFVDARPRPAVRLETRALAGTIDGIGGEASHTVIELGGRLASSLEDGRIALSWRRPHAGLGTVGELTMRLEGLDAAVLAPYAATWAGSRIIGGQLDLLASYERRGVRLLGRSDWQIRGLVLEPVDAAPWRQPPSPAPVSPGGLSLAFAAALHADPSAQIDLSMPLEARVSPTDPDLPGVLGAALRRRIEASTMAPFDALAAVVGRDADTLSGVPFAAGSAEISAAARAGLDALADALIQRPALALMVPGEGTSAADRDALAEEQIRIHVTLATADAARPEPPSQLDFAAPRIQAILDEFAGERLATAQRAALSARFDAAETGEPAARAPYYAAVFRSLAANEEIAPSTLRRLARFRAQAIVAALEALGVEARRLAVVDAAAAEAGPGPAVRVPLQLGLAEEGPGQNRGAAHAPPASPQWAAVASPGRARPARAANAAGAAKRHDACIMVGQPAARAQLPEQA